MKIILGQEYTWKPTTNEFRARVVRRLTEDETDPEVGPMYEIVVHAYADELSAATTTYEGLLSEIADILYPLDGYRDDQWNGGDVCEAVADILHRYMPEAATRQPEWSEEEEAHECIRVWVLDEPTRGWCDICDRTMDADVCPTCNGAGATGANGPEPDSCTSCRGMGWAPRKGFEEYEAERRRLGL